METLESASRPPEPRLRSRAFHQSVVFLLTFAAYSAFHAARKPPSIVKSVLSGDSGGGGWPPFDGPSGPHRLGELDLAFLSSYAFAMFFAGHLGDRADLRLFLAGAMVASGVASAAFGLAFWLHVHQLAYFVIVQAAAGVTQSAGWPCVVAVVGNWFGKSRRGLLMGVWNAHTSVGNVIGSLIAAAMLEFGWGWSFLVPGLLIAAMAVLVLTFLVADPRDLVCEPSSAAAVAAPEIQLNGRADEIDEGVGLLGEKDEMNGLAADDLDSELPPDLPRAIGFLEAWQLPGVAPFALCLFFSKLVSYTFLYWLPFYIRNNAVAGKLLSHKTSGILSSIFDIGSVLGGISAGFLSDAVNARALTSVSFLFLSIPALIVYRAFGSYSMYHTVGLMFVAGYFVNAPYSLITTAVAMDLGTQDAIRGNSRALATVSAIIDGTGSVGAALGPLLTGYISTRGWNSVFVMLIVSICLAILLLIPSARAELMSKMYSQR